jgi:hypothetical protein
MTSTDEATEAGFMRRMSIRFHLLMCKHCIRYVQQINSLGAAVKGTLEERRKRHDPEVLERLEKRILGAIGPDGKPRA